MKDIIEKIRQGELDGTILNRLKLNKKDEDIIEEYYNEYTHRDRSIRDTQIGKTQKDKSIYEQISTGEYDNSGEPIMETRLKEIVKAIRTPVNFAKKITRTSVAFEFANPVKLIPSEANQLFETVLQVWKKNRLDSKLQELKEIQRSQTQTAIIFNILKKNNTPEIKSKVLDFNSGVFHPVFDDFGDMILFVWEFKTKKEDTEIRNLWIYDEKLITKYQSDSDGWKLDQSESHGFDIIPCVYMSQEAPEHEDVKELIDRYETLLSKLGASNNYSGSPLLFTVGEVSGMPDRDSDGKLLNAPVVYDEDTGKPVHGDAKFLTHDNAPKSVELELHELKGLINYLTSTPDLSFDSLKGIGNVTGVALELMFLDSKLKALSNQGQNTTDIQRIVNVIKSGICTTTEIKLNSFRKKLIYDVDFQSVLPNDLAGIVSTLKTAIDGRFMSRETAIKIISLSENAIDELENINKDIQNEITSHGDQ